MVIFNSYVSLPEGMVLFYVILVFEKSCVPLNPVDYHHVPCIKNSHSLCVRNSPRELAQPNKLYTWTFKSTKKKLSGWNFERKSAQTVRKSCRHATLAHLDQTFGNQVTQELLVIILDMSIKIACGTTLSQINKF